MSTTQLPRVLFVDDEPNLLDGLVRNMRRVCEPVRATSGAEALVALEHDPDIALVVSDMQMPMMNGAALLRRVRQKWPDTVRIMLTGLSDVNAAMSAVNEGSVFRFLRKPCTPEELRATLEAAFKQHQLLIAERVLLEQTLHGSVKALSEVLAMVMPVAFGRASRVKATVGALARGLQLDQVWEIEVAAMLSQVAAVSLPPATAERIYKGQPLSADEQEMASRMPEVAVKLIADIPRLDGVREILRLQAKRFDGHGPPADERRGEEIPAGARLLKLVLDFDDLETREGSGEAALTVMRGRDGAYDPKLLAALGKLQGATPGGVRAHELGLGDLREGMVFVEDLLSTTGLVLVARGQEVTAGLLERIRNFAKNAGIAEPIRVTTPRPELSQQEHPSPAAVSLAGGAAPTAPAAR